MAGINNRTARQFNLKVMGKKGHKLTVRIAPGFNVVEDKFWDQCKNDPYVKLLKKQGKISYGKAEDDMELEKDPDTVSKVKDSPPPEDKAKEKEKADAKEKAEEDARIRLEAEAKVKKEMEAEGKEDKKSKAKEDKKSKAKEDKKSKAKEDDEKGEASTFGADDTKPPLKPPVNP